VPLAVSSGAWLVLPHNRRLWAGLIPAGLFTGALVGALIAPRAYLGNSVYWLSVFWFAVVGGVLLGNPNRASRVPRWTSIGLSFFVAVLALQPASVPQSSVILYGVIGLFVGFGLRMASFLYLETKWMWCDYCKRDYWHMKRAGVWECQRSTHAIIHG